MTFAVKRQALAMLILACAAQAERTPQAGKANQPSGSISLCDLTQHWEKYDHKSVRIEAIYHAGNEVSQVYDVSCATSDHTAWVKLLPYGSPSPIPPELKDKLAELLRRDGRARITVVGEFDGPKKVDIPPGLSPEAAAVFLAGGSRYGHMNQWRFQFVFSKVEKVETVARDVPWPHLADQKNQ